ncbi:hypothetical protein BUALT_Bualt10G0029900 [Buddleja alternifolia]|uniref:Uncharacterized protein n=1 Tax=Buddleja alternifolia TaxID=168488 RepID=A0AAV6WWG8_9LAMI|nr:hypothetical protein BUALT_Bualt10G0029900 [Buddleja alternifolia]
MASSSSLRLNLAIPTSTFSKSTKLRNPTTKIRCIGWDPEGILGAPKSGHIARIEFKRRLEKDSEAREAFERQVRDEKERRRALRQCSCSKLLYVNDRSMKFLELDYLYGFVKPLMNSHARLNEDFFSHLKLELGKLRFAVSKTQDIEDRVIELETLEKALQEGIDAYDKMQSELITARKSLMKILTSDDIKATLLDMVEQNELNRSLLTLLDENIANAYQGNQTQAADYMEKIRGVMLKYITV